MRNQKAVKGGRKKLYPIVIKEIEREVERLAHKHGVSKSFVMSVIMADAFDIKKQERF